MRGEARTVFFGRVSSHRESRLDLARQHTKLRRYRLNDPSLLCGGDAARTGLLALDAV
jgi:hypothetical protein